MPIRLKDIAQDIGVSVVTVSKVLRGCDDVGPETRERVLKRMEELEYRPNIVARGLATGRSYTVGLIVPDLLQTFFAELAKGMSGELRKHGYGLILASSEEDPNVEQQEIDNLLARRVDALLIASCQWNDAKLGKTLEHKIPCILIDRMPPGVVANFIGSDDVRVGEIATQHLVDIGRRRIAHIGGQNLSTASDRLRGYRKVLAEQGIRVPRGYIITRFRMEEAGDIIGYQAMQQLLRLQSRPDAVFCYNDLTAMGAMRAALEAGLRIPEDIAFVGCGNFRYAENLVVPLTSVNQFTISLGERAAKLALSLIAAKKNTVIKKILVQPQLVVRRSTQRMS